MRCRQNDLVNLEIYGVIKKRKQTSYPKLREVLKKNNTRYIIMVFENTNNI